MLQALIFDFDGVIVQSEEATFHLLQNIVSEHGYSLDNSAFGKRIGRKVIPFLDEIYDTRLPQAVQSSITRAFYQEYTNNPLKYVTPVAPVISFLTTYTGPYPLGIASMSEKAAITQILAHFRLQDKFKCIISSDDVARLKPDPEVYIKSAQCLGIAPSTGVVIEDSIPGARAAIAAGFQTYILLTGINNKLDYYDYNIKGFILSQKDITDILQSSSPSKSTSNA